MSGFNFEKNLKHQTAAVNSIVSVFKNLPIKEKHGLEGLYTNPIVEIDNSRYRYFQNIREIQSLNGIKTEIGKTINKNSNIIDIMMETGTGKTYTYTKAIFELNRHYKIFKFIIIVPTLSIKAGTIDFLKSKSAREHFKEQYGKTINLHVVESVKNKKNKKNYMPFAVSEFARAENQSKNEIQVLLINAGMINSDTMNRNYDRTIFDRYDVPFEALAATKPFVIIDEPHRFARINRTWKNIEKLKAQFIFRFGATFHQYDNLIYKLTAVDAFNSNLVKGVIGYV